MRVLQYIIILIPLLLGCEFRAEKVEFGSSCITKGGSEIYLVKNYPKDVKTRDKFFFDFARKNMQDFYKLDSCITMYSIGFYKDSECTRRYIKNIETLRGVESLYERCQDDDLGGFLYKRLKDNPKIWYLSYPKEFNDTIYCE